MCKLFGWTYQEYISTPLWLIETVKIRNTAEAYFNEKEARKTKSQMRFKK